jgi:hypothetical protein
MRERFKSRQLQITRIISGTLVFLLTLGPILRVVAIVLTTGANNLSNDYLRFAHLISRILDGGYNWQNYFRDTFWNGHSLALPVLVYLAVAKFARWNVYVEMCIGIVMGMIRLVLLYDAFVQSKDQRIKWVLWPILSALIFSVSQMSVFTFGFTNIHMMLNQLGVALGVWGLARFPDQWRGILSVSLGGIVAAFSWSGGVMAWPALFIGLVLAQFRRGLHYGVWVISGVTAALPYMMFMLLHPTHGAVKSFRVVSWLNLSFILRAIGRPFAHGIEMKAETSGGLGVALAVVGILLLFARKSKAHWTKVTPAVVLMGYSTLSIWQASIFRSNVALWYATPAMSFWIGLTGLAYTVCSTHNDTGILHIRMRKPFCRLEKLWIIGGVISVGLLYVRANISYEDKVFHLFSRSPASAACLRNYRTAPTYCESYVFQWGVGQPGILSMLGQSLERHRLSVFAPHQRWALQGDFVLDTVRVTETPGVPDIFWSADLTASPVRWSHYRHLNLFLHTPNAVEWEITLPASVERADFHSAIAMSQSAPDDLPSDGTVFEVSIMPEGKSRELVFSRHVTLDQRTWQPFQVSLDRYAGTTISIEIASRSGDNTGDWAMYRYPYIDVSLHPNSSIKSATIEPSNTDLGSIPKLTSSDFRFDVTKSSLWDITGMTPVIGEQQHLWVVGKDPSMHYTLPFGVCLSDYTHIYVRMAASPDIKPRALQIYYLLDDQSVFREAHSLTIPLLPDEELHEYTYDLKLLELPKQIHLTGIRLDPVYGAPSSGDNYVQIEDMRLIHSQRTDSFCTK